MGLRGVDRIVRKLYNVCRYFTMKEEKSPVEKIIVDYIAAVREEVFVPKRNEGQEGERDT